MAELVTRPLDAVRRMFQQCGDSQAGDWGVRAAFEAALADPAVLAQVQIGLCADAWSGTSSVSKPCAQLPTCTKELLNWSMSAIHLQQRDASDCGQSCCADEWQCGTLSHTGLRSLRLVVSFAGSVPQRGHHRRHPAGGPGPVSWHGAPQFTVPPTAVIPSQAAPKAASTCLGTAETAHCASSA
jgi:hypothetical protein